MVGMQSRAYICKQMCAHKMNEQWNRMKDYKTKTEKKKCCIGSLRNEYLQNIRMVYLHMYILSGLVSQKPQKAKALPTGYMYIHQEYSVTLDDRVYGSFIIVKSNGAYEPHTLCQGQQITCNSFPKTCLVQTGYSTPTRWFNAYTTCAVLGKEVM